ncbi:MFS transporter [Micromonospora sp. AMSO12t]|uniref:MFS transporter n=1 Tax=unclassified Micromonospora TaxID=2617518 RepID=UPI001788B0B7|nr:MFS transporter [Micromonospora sp. AMSO12t]
MPTEESLTAERSEGHRPSPPPLRRNRDFQLFWIGSAISAFGSRASSIAYPLLVLALTGSAADAGIVGFAATLPYLLLQLPFGALADRSDRRRVLLVADASRGLVLAAVAAAVVLDWVSLPWLVLAAFVEGALTVLSGAAEPAAVRHLVHPDQFPNALAQQEARDRAAMLAGQPVGGALFAVGRAVPFVFDALSYLASLVALLLIRKPMQEPRERVPRRPPFRSEILRGLTWLWRRPFFRNASLLVAGSNFLFQALTLVLIVRATQQGASPFMVGVILAGAGVGGVLGAAAAPRIRRALSLPAVILLTHWVWAVMLPVFAVLTEPVLVALLFAAVAFVGPVWNVAVVAARVAATPDELQGRVTTASKLASYGAIPLGSLVAGWVIEMTGATWTAVAISVAMVLLAVLATASPAIRRGIAP